MVAKRRWNKNTNTKKHKWKSKTYHNNMDTTKQREKKNLGYLDRIDNQKLISLSANLILSTFTQLVSRFSLPTHCCPLLLTLL